MENLDNIIKKNFNSDIHFKRVKKEMALLKEMNSQKYKVQLQNSVLGLKIIVEVTKDGIIQKLPQQYYSFLQKTSFLVFEVLLEPSFPFLFPKIFSRTNFSQPSISDGRDLLQDIIKQVWSPQITINQIINQLPEFISNIVQQQNDLNYLMKIGTFHLGHLYNLEDFLVLDQVDCFPCQEILQSNSVEQRYIVITQTNFLNFEINDKKKNIVKLVNWANLKSLLNIKKQKNNDGIIILNWRDNLSNNGYNQVIKLSETKRFIELLIKNMKLFGVKINRNLIKQPDLTEKDVTLLAYEDFNINTLLENIMIMESRLNDELTVQNVNILMSLYQKAIEYFSAINDPEYEDFIERMQSLLKREDVSILLRSQTETSIHSSSTKSSNIQSKQSHNNKSQQQNLLDSAHQQEDEEEEEKENHSIPADFKIEENQQIYQNNQSQQKPKIDNIFNWCQNESDKKQQETPKKENVNNFELSQLEIQNMQQNIQPVQSVNLLDDINESEQQKQSSSIQSQQNTPQKQQDNLLDFEDDNKLISHHQTSQQDSPQNKNEQLLNEEQEQFLNQQNKSQENQKQELEIQKLKEHLEDDQNKQEIQQNSLEQEIEQIEQQQKQKVDEDNGNTVSKEQHQNQEIQI